MGEVVTAATPAELTLDPADWRKLRALGHQMLDDMMDYLATVRERPPWQPVPPEVRARLDEPVPHVGQDPARVYDSFKRDVLPYPTGNIHPRFWGWVMGTGTPIGMLAEMLAAAMNSDVAGYDQSATLVEQQVVGWLADLIGFPKQASGLLVSGATAASLEALTVARNARAGFDVREEGLQERAHPSLVFYASTETHTCVRKAAELLGLGRRALRQIPVGRDFTIDLVALREAIAADRTMGRRPFCIVGNAGTVRTGATDDLRALADVAEHERLWFHVDGAFGPLACLSARVRPLVAGLERADSLAFDLHTWGWAPYEAGCILVRNGEQHRKALAITPMQLRTVTRGIAASKLLFTEQCIQRSRGFRALKIWMTFKVYGVRTLGRLIEQNVAHAQYLKRLIEADARLELLAPAPLNVVNFRFRVPGFGAASLDRLNEEILVKVQEEGVAVPSHALVHDAFALRVAITNHRSRREDFDALVRAVVRFGERLANTHFRGVRQP